ASHSASTLCCRSRPGACPRAQHVATTSSSRAQQSRAASAKIRERQRSEAFTAQAKLQLRVAANGPRGPAYLSDILPRERASRVATCHEKRVTRPTNAAPRLFRGLARPLLYRLPIT